MKRVVARLAVGLAVLGSFGVIASSALAASPDVVISQVYGGGGNAGATYTNDFVELYNRGSSAVSLSGWSVQYGSATGTTWSVTSLTGSIAAGAHYLVQEAAGAGGTTALPTPDASGNIAMSATAGKVALVTSTTALSGCPAPLPKDLVGYGSTANCVETAAAPGLSNTTADLRADNGADTDNNSADFTAGAPNPRNGASTPPPPPPSMKIDEIQGNGQFSPVVGQKVQTTGIVTELRTTGSVRGYYIEDPNWDADPSTSEGVFVFQGSTSPTVHVGDAVTVVATVTEFISANSGDLPETELTSPTTTVTSTGNATPLPVVIGQGGLTPPTQSLPDGIAFDESLEGMLVELDDIQTVSATNSFGEVWVLPNNGAGAGPLSNRGGIVLQQDDQNPEKFLIDDDAQPSGSNMPTVDVGAHAAGAQIGVMDYAFDNYTIHVLNLPTFTPSANDRETTTVSNSATKLTVATFNVENLAPSDPDSKFAGLANVLVNNLGSPDIVALEEVQDNSGATDDGTVDSTDTLNKLAAAVVAAGGPQYDFRWINPVNDQDGGQPGGNIRVVFFFRTDVPALSFAPGTAGGSLDANAVVGTAADTHLQYNPGRIDPTSSAWDASRKPLAGEFTFNGHNVFLIANHFVSKLGDDPMWGSNQPPVNSSETQRHQQANEDASFVTSLLGADPGANIVLLGDLNDFQFSDTVSILEGSGVHDLVKDLPVAEQYTYVFGGNSQAIDHILVGGGLLSAPRDYDVVHVNSEFATQTSDHDPQVVSFELPPASVSAGGPYSVPEGGSATLHATGNGTIAWDLDNNGTYETPGADATFDASTIDGPATRTVGVQLTTADGATATDTAQVTITNVAPTATFHSPSSATVGSSFTISLSDATDPASADSFTYAFDCGDGFGAYGTATSQSCVADTPGSQTVSARIKDDDGGVTTYTAQVAVNVTVGGLCRLTVSYVESSAKYQSLPAGAKKVADALAQAACNALDRLPTSGAPRKAAVNAYISAVNGLRSAGWLTADQAATLTALATAL
jgi:predicted extracellular nuclease